MLRANSYETPQYLHLRSKWKYYPRVHSENGSLVLGTCSALERTRNFCQPTTSRSFSIHPNRINFTVQKGCLSTTTTLSKRLSPSLLVVSEDDYFIDQVIQQPLFAYSDFPGGAPANISVDDGVTDLGSNIEQISVDAEGYITRDYKSELQEHVQKMFGIPSTYELKEESGPDHEKEFTMAVFVKEKECGRGIGSSKKLASQLAAENALLRIKEEPSFLQIENFN